MDEAQKQMMDEVQSFMMARTLGRAVEDLHAQITFGHLTSLFPAFEHVSSRVLASQWASCRSRPTSLARRLESTMVHLKHCLQGYALWIGQCSDTNRKGTYMKMVFGKRLQ